MGIEKTCDPENTAHSLFTKLELNHVYVMMIPCLCHEPCLCYDLMQYVTVVLTSNSHQWLVLFPSSNHMNVIK